MTHAHKAGKCALFVVTNGASLVYTLAARDAEVLLRRAHGSAYIILHSVRIRKKKKSFKEHWWEGGSREKGYVYSYG